MLLVLCPNIMMLNGKEYKAILILDQHWLWGSGGNRGNRCDNLGGLCLNYMLGRNIQREWW